MNENYIEWVTPAGNIGRCLEETSFTFQLTALLTPDSKDFGDNVLYEVTGGIFPMNLTLSSSGLISGTVIDMDNYVPEFQKPEGFVIARDGSNYGSYGSSLAHTRECEFEVRAYYDDGITLVEEFRTFGIMVINNYSSDRNQFIRDYSEAYGE